MNTGGDQGAQKRKRSSKKRKLPIDDDVTKADDDECSPQKASPHHCTSLLNNHYLHSQLPSFLSEAFSDLYGQDGLVVLGRGLGWLSLLAAFVRFYGDPDSHTDNDDCND